ncbi:MAG: hypothetical protein MUP19_06515, partial [Candidatus Aminicenantes bacterium]|nr:hypothetical protein [Candidatus Aminicenantes bacterium]
TSQHAKLLRDPSFGRQFEGLNLKDFYGYNVTTAATLGESRVTAIRNPAPQAEDDFRAALRAVKKNLILVDEFLLGNKYKE